MSIDIPSGEKIQQIADIYLGNYDDLIYNPLIALQQHKWCFIDSIPDIWNNPRIIFCYSHRANDFSNKLQSLQNPCIILFTNSDQNMTYELCKLFLESEKIKYIFCQNIHFSHPKASWLPIGLANKQWSHGNPLYIESINISTLKKTKSIFCSFSVNTNQSIREPCLKSIERLSIQNIQYTSQLDYITALSSHKYAICPEGNGVDTHRFWEALFVQTIPIVIKNSFTEILYSNNIPCILINSWDTFDPSSLPEYTTFVFDDIFYYTISFNNFYNQIMEKTSLCNI